MMSLEKMVNFISVFEAGDMIENCPQSKPKQRSGVFEMIWGEEPHTIKMVPQLNKKNQNLLWKPYGME